MDIDTSLSPTFGSSAATATIIKRRAVGKETVTPFALKEDGSLLPETKSPDREEAAKPVISDSERQFFTSMFPSAADAIQNYSPYQRNGTKRSVGIGTLVDVKG